MSRFQSMAVTGARTQGSAGAQPWLSDCHPSRNSPTRDLGGFKTCS